MKKNYKIFSENNIETILGYKFNRYRICSSDFRID